jgi:hypothetical protein
MGKYFYDIHIMLDDDAFGSAEMWDRIDQAVDSARYVFDLKPVYCESSGTPLGLRDVQLTYTGGPDLSEKIRGYLTRQGLIVLGCYLVNRVSRDLLTALAERARAT